MSKLDLGEYTPQAGAPKALFAEALGTCILVLAAAGASAASGPLSGGDASPWANGLTLTVLIMLFGPVSHAHFNPAITLGMTMRGHLSKGRMLPYMLAQFLGAVVASLILRVLLRSTVIGQNSTQMPFLAALLLEALLTFWLQWVVLATAEKDLPPWVYAPAAGITVAGNIYWAGHLSGASMNPFRSLGPALVAWDLSDLPIYLIGPFVGSVAAVMVYGWYRKLK